MKTSTLTVDRPRYGHGTGIPNPIDIDVGKRIRTRRLSLSMSQESLAIQLGLTFRQVQKYESGANRVSASRLFVIANVLGVPILFFFADDPDLALDTLRERKTHQAMERREAIELVRRFHAITDINVRQSFLELVKAVAANR